MKRAFLGTVRWMPAHPEYRWAMDEAMTCSTTPSWGANDGASSCLAALSGARPVDEVLDVGCGTGGFTRVMAECAPAARCSSTSDRPPAGSAAT